MARRIMRIESEPMIPNSEKPRKPEAARMLRARAVVWSRLENMNYFAEMP